MLRQLLGASPHRTKKCLVYGWRVGPICGARTGFGHAVEDHDTLTTAARRKRLFGRTDTTVDILPVVHHPDVARWVDAEIALHLQTSSHVATRG